MHLYKKTKNNIEYYYLRETKRVEGKVVCSFQKYIGNKERLFEIIQDGLNPNSKLISSMVTDSQVYSYGAVAVLNTIAEKIELAAFIDKYCTKRNQDMPISNYMIIAAINRAINAKSKNAIAGWVEKTSLPSLINNLNLKKLTSQNFWNNMDSITDDQINNTQSDLTQKIVSLYDISLNAVLYDSTNYYSYIHSFNEKPTIEQRGKNKQKRTDLRQSNFCILATKDYHIPLYHRIYDGNTNDYDSFGKIVVDLKDKRDLLCKSQSSKSNKFILVFDSGNVSDSNMKLINEYSLKFISKLKPSNYKELLRIDLSQYKQYIKNNDDVCNDTMIHVLNKKIYGTEKKVVIKYNQAHYDAEYKTLNNHLSETEKEMKALQIRLNGYIENNKLPSNVTSKTVANNIVSIFKNRTYLKKIIKVEVLEEDNFPILRWDVDPNNLKEYIQTYLGKTIYFTNDLELSGDEIVQTYSYQFQIEKLFKISKDRKAGCWWPKYHFTDQKIKVHAFYCYISLLLVSLLELELDKIKIKHNINNIIEELSDIHEIVDEYKNNNKKSIIVRRHSKLNTLQKKIFDYFNLKCYFSR